jgi:hypothetical protein
MVTDDSAVLASPASVPDAARQVDNIDEEFFALIYSDEELLRAEFDALMAAEWSSPPPPTAARGRGAERPSRRARPDLPKIQGSCPAAAVTGVRGPGVRTRSPPSIRCSSPSRLTTKGGLATYEKPESAQSAQAGWLGRIASVRSPSSA